MGFCKTHQSTKESAFSMRYHKGLHNSTVIQIYASSSSADVSDYSILRRTLHGMSRRRPNGGSRKVLSMRLQEQRGVV